METHLAPSVPVVSEQTVKSCSYIALNFGSLDVATNKVSINLKSVVLVHLFGVVVLANSC